MPGAPVGKYVIRFKLAEGGMAEVYVASAVGPEGFQKEVVIKRIRPYLAQDHTFIQMFIAEARIASRLNHPNIVQIFDFDFHHDAYYLAMEYVRGKSLADIAQQLIAQGQAMRPLLAAQIGSEVAKALHYVHRLTDRESGVGLVHRDVTPHNILVSFDGAIKLTDFGIAKAGNQATAPGTLKGKFAYMSPEQARGQDVDGRTDVFALGVVIWELLTGKRLFNADSEVGLLHAVSHAVIEPPSRHNPEVPGELDAIVLQALTRELARRTTNAQELERALANFVLSRARTLEDADVRGFVRGLFPREASMSFNAVVELGVRAMAGTAHAATASFPEPKTQELSGSAARPTELDVPIPPRARPAVTLPVSDASLVRAAMKPRGGRAALFAALLGLGLLSLGGGYLAFRGPSAPTPGPAPSPLEPATADPGGLTAAADAQDAAAAVVEPTAAAADAGEVSAEGAMAVLVLRARPWAEIYVDGVSLGIADVNRTRFTVAAGRHTLQFKHPARTSRAYALDLEPGKTQVREFDAWLK